VLAAGAAGAVVAALVVHPLGRPDELAGPVPPAPVATPSPPGPSPSALDLAALRKSAATLGSPVYWIGPRESTTYELRRGAQGNVLLRYLPDGARPGTEGVFVTVGTYSIANAFEATRAFVAGGSFGSRPLTGGGLAVYRLAQPTNVYVVYPGLDYQLEVFSPEPGEALRLATEELRPLRQ
jgi:hypothetical protein